MKIILLLSLLSVLQPALAESEHREHAAHVHGHATLNLAWSGSELQVLIESPAMNLLGFEHAAVTDADKNQLSKTIAALRDPESLISLNQQAGCKLNAVKIESALLQAGVVEEHSDFDISIDYQCVNLQNLRSVDLSGIFKQFPELEELDAQWVSDTVQSAAEVGPDHSTLILK